MASRVDIEQAETEVLVAVQRAFRQYMAIVKSTVFVDPTRPDWLVWPEQAWYQLVEEIVKPVVARVSARQAAREGLRGAAAASFVATLMTQMQELFLNSHIPNRVLEESVKETQTQDYQEDPEVAASLLLLATSPLWFPMLGVFAMNLGSQAVNEAVFAGAVAASREGEVIKTWNAVHDDRTRQTHKIADGQKVRLGDAFIIGGFPLRFPHDPFGPPQETINCRCVLSFGVDNV